MSAPRIEGFAPIVGAAPRVLILGSMPSVASLDRHQYYGHARNRFWPLIGELFGIAVELAYPARARALADRGVAVWDVVRSCRRQGSSDATIQAVEVNDFAGFFGEHAGIEALFFNGRKAADLFERRVRPTLPAPWGDLVSTVLPSTSPANASIPDREKLRQWRAVVAAVDRDRRQDRRPDSARVT